MRLEGEIIELSKLESGGVKAVFIFECDYTDENAKDKYFAAMGSLYLGDFTVTDDLR